MAFEKGTRIRADITGTVTGRMGTETGYGDGYDYAKVTRVAQRKDGRWNHLLDLSSSGVTVSDGLLRARFDAVVTGEPRRSVSVTTQVREDDGTVHYLYLDSAAVTAVNTGRMEILTPEEHAVLTTLRELHARKREYRNAGQAKLAAIQAHAEADDAVTRAQKSYYDALMSMEAASGAECSG